MVKMPSDVSLLRINMQVIKDLFTFQPVFGTMKTKPSHSYGPTITLRLSEDECLLPMGLIKEYIVKTKDR